jgi:thiamine kinase-like enzyme
MSSTISPAEALSRIPGWDVGSATWRKLKGGLTNRTYLVERGDEFFVLRLDATHMRSLNLDRIGEIRIQKNAAKAGLAPELIFAGEDYGILLSRYILGQTWSDADLNDDKKLEALAELLHRVHALPTSGILFEPNHIVKRYAANLKTNHRLYAFALRCEEIIANIPRIGKFNCCHNDVVAPNIIADPALKLLDWEYSCDNDPMFDLASLIGFHNLVDSRQSILLNAYAGGKDFVLKERLDIQVRVYDVIQWLWFANRQLVRWTSAQALRLEKLQRRILCRRITA